VLVDGRAEKPAVEGASDKDVKDQSQVLIKIINSAQGFPVELVYATSVSKVQSLGTVQGRLPRPDMIATASHWSVYLPEGLSYGEADSNMEVVGEGEFVSRDAMQAEMGAAAAGAPSAVEPPRLAVPNAGVLFRFDKLYANRADEDAEFSIPYASAGGAFLAQVLMALATLMFWGGLTMAYRGHARLRRRWFLTVSGASALVVLVITTYLGTSPTTAIVITCLIGAGVAGRFLLAWLKRWVATRPPRPPPPSGTGTSAGKTEQTVSAPPA
jgi:hypothetical protein